jgi:hypothetical protein
MTLSALLALGAPPAGAHHSGARFYGQDQPISLTGVEPRLSFRHPHATVELQVTDDQGDVQRWTAETAAPSALRRRGWSQESLQPGEMVTLEGFRARDGTLLMRITKVTRADGTDVGDRGARVGSARI